MEDFETMVIAELAGFRKSVDEQITRLPKSHKVETLESRLSFERHMTDTVLENYSKLVATLEESVAQRDQMLAEFGIVLGLEMPQKTLN